MVPLRFALIGWLLSPIAFAYQASPLVSTQDELKAEFQSVPCKNSERQEAVKALFGRMGAKEVSVENYNTAQFKKVENLVVRKPGNADKAHSK